MPEMNDNIVELIDDSGQTVKFEHLDTLQLNNNTYVILTPINDTDEEESDVYIMRLKEDNGEEVLELVEDEKEVESVFQEFRSRTEGDFEFID